MSCVARGEGEGCRAARRLLALAAVRDGMNRTEAARIGGMDRQTLRDWAHRFNQYGPDGLIDIKPTGRPSKLSDEQKEALKQLVETGPDPEKDGVVRWRCVDLKRVSDSASVSMSEVSLGRALKKLGFSHVSARPRHPVQDPEAIAAFKKTPHAGRGDRDQTRPRNADRGRFQDEMRACQKNSLVYQWAKKGSRPRQPKDQRYENAYVFGAVCASRDTGVALIIRKPTPRQCRRISTPSARPSRPAPSCSSSTRPDGTRRAN